MVTLESFVISIFDFIRKLLKTLVTVYFDGRLIFGQLCTGQRDQYLDARVYLVVAILFSFAIFSSSGGTTFYARLSSVYGGMSGSNIILYTMLVALLQYGAVYGFGKLLGLSPKYLSVFVDYVLLWMGTYMYYFTIMIFSLYWTMGWQGNSAEGRLVLSNAPFAMLVFVAAGLGGFVPAKGLHSLGVLSRLWYKFMTIVVIAPGVLIVSLLLVLSVQSAHESYLETWTDIEQLTVDLKVGTESPNNVLYYVVSDSVSDTARVEITVRMRVFNRSETLYYLGRNIHVVDSVNDFGNFAAVFHIDSQTDLLQIPPRTISSFVMKTWIPRADCDVLKKREKERRTSEREGRDWDIELMLEVLVVNNPLVLRVQERGFLVRATAED